MLQTSAAPAATRMRIIARQPGGCGTGHVLVRPARAAAAAAATVGGQCGGGPANVRVLHLPPPLTVTGSESGTTVSASGANPAPKLELCRAPTSKPYTVCLPGRRLSRARARRRPGPDRLGVRPQSPASLSRLPAASAGARDGRAVPAEWRPGPDRGSRAAAGRGIHCNGLPGSDR